MSRQVQTARGVIIDFDELQIKQQLAAAPMNIEVARRKNFIENKEVPGKQKIPDSQIVNMMTAGTLNTATNFIPEKKIENFENENELEELPTEKPKFKK